ncbi:hypothetical protein ABT124_49690, partial [Streptomyces sp. NPDC001982]
MAHTPKTRRLAAIAVATLLAAGGASLSTSAFAATPTEVPHMTVAGDGNGSHNGNDNWGNGNGSHNGNDNWGNGNGSHNGNDNWGNGNGSHNGNDNWGNG